MPKYEDMSEEKRFRSIRIHGRGGQGAVTSSQVLAIAASFDGKHSQAFPSFGVERRGAPVQSFVRISDDDIRIRQQVYKPNYVIVLDPSLLETVDVTQGVDEKGKIMVNSGKHPKELNLNTKAKVYTVDVTKKAIEVMGKPFVNLAILAFFAYATKEITVDALKKAVEQRFGGKMDMVGLNINAIDFVLEECKRVIW